MKKFKLIYLLICWLIANIAVSQTESKRDKIEALRVSFISQKVNFTTQEAQAFWPLYNEYQDKIILSRKAFRQQYNKNTDYNFTTDKEAEAYLNAEITLKQKEFEYYKDYLEKFKKIIPVKKIALLLKAEEEFKKELIKNIKGNSPE
jgi:hypothetical protein